jgi:tetratricopeptide (TPR) repeat protein
MILINLRPLVPLLVAIAAASSPVAADETRVDAVGQAIEGEFALQNGDAAGAARYYLAAALASDDPGVAEHAARIALAADDLDSARAALARWQQLVPDNTVQAALAMHVDLRRGQVASALAQARRMLLQPKGWQYLIPPLADTRTDHGAAARRVIRDLLEHDQFPDQVDAWLAFAGLARRIDDSALTADIETRLVARFPNDPKAQLIGVERLRDGGDSAGARAMLDRMLAGGPYSPDIRHAIAGELAMLGDGKAAAQVLAKGEQDDSSYAQRATWLSDADDKAGLAALYAEIKATSLTPSRRLLLGEIAELQSRWPEAEQWYLGIDTSPMRERARLRLPGVLEKQGRMDAAVALLRQLQDDSESGGENRRDAYLQEAELWGRRKDDKQALATYARAFAAFPDDALLLYGRGLYQQGQGRVDAALADLKRILDRDGDNAEALNAYGYTLAESRQQYAEALPFIEKSNRLKPNSAATLDSLGWVELKLGAREKALALLRQAWTLQKDPEIAAHLGEALWLSGDQTGARRIWQAGLAIDADNQPLQAMLRKYPL